MSLDLLESLVRLYWFFWILLLVFSQALAWGPRHSAALRELPPWTFNEWKQAQMQLISQNKAILEMALKFEERLLAFNRGDSKNSANRQAYLRRVAQIKEEIELLKHRSSMVGDLTLRDYVVGYVLTLPGEGTDLKRVAARLSREETMELMKAYSNTLKTRISDRAVVQPE